VAAKGGGKAKKAYRDAWEGGRVRKGRWRKAEKRGPGWGEEIVALREPQKVGKVWERNAERE